MKHSPKNINIFSVSYNTTLNGLKIIKAIITTKIKPTVSSKIKDFLESFFFPLRIYLTEDILLGYYAQTFFKFYFRKGGRRVGRRSNRRRERREEGERETLM